jgi:hypothetical protein
MIITTLATSQNPLKKPQAAAPSLAACRMDKLGAEKKDKITQNILGFQEHKIKSFAWRAYGRHAISTVIINYNNNDTNNNNS